MRTASPRAKMLCSLGAAENHIWRMTTFDKMREADDERASALKAVPFSLARVVFAHVCGIGSASDV